MIEFDKLPLNTRTLHSLSKLNIDFTFQPIFSLKDNSLFAYEALMQPADGTITDLLDIYTRKRELHIIEVASIFGATMAYYERGYDVPFFVNSLPSEVTLPEESKVFYEFFPKNVKDKLMVQIIEYPELIYMNWTLKKKQLESHGIKIALDNYGAGYNDITTFYIIEPHMVMLDNFLVENISWDKHVQQNFIRTVDMFHKDNIAVVAKGIENKEDYDFIKTTNVDYIQGFYLGRPQ